MTPMSPLESFARLMGVEAQPTPESGAAAPPLAPDHQPSRAAQELLCMLSLLRREQELREIGAEVYREACNWFHECRNQELERSGAHPDNERTE